MSAVLVNKQIARWMESYELSNTPHLPALDKLAET